MTLSTLIFVLSITIQSSMAVLFASIGEVSAERSRVLNLGVEGMMLMGALSGFATAHATGSLALGVLAAMATGGLLALVHGAFTITLRANQALCGLALAILGTGLASFLGRPLIGGVGVRFVPWPVPMRSEIPVLGPVLFAQVPLVYLGYVGTRVMLLPVPHAPRVKPAGGGGGTLPPRTRRESRSAEPGNARQRSVVRWPALGARISRWPTRQAGKRT